MDSQVESGRHKIIFNCREVTALNHRWRACARVAANSHFWAALSGSPAMTAGRMALVGLPRFCSCMPLGTVRLSRAIRGFGGHCSVGLSYLRRVSPPAEGGGKTHASRRYAKALFT